MLSRQEPRAGRLFSPSPARRSIASIAYMDPGNFATNIQAGAKYGYGLLWVVLLANLIAMLFQALSAKLGIVTGRNLAEMCREQFPQPVVIAMWMVSEVAAMATDLAEFLGGAIGLSLLFQLPLLRRHGGHRRSSPTAILMFESRGFRPIELIIGAGRHHRALLPGRDVHRAGRLGARRRLHSVLPQIPDAEALMLVGRHHRRDGDAARDLSAFRPDPGAHAGAQRRASAASCCVSPTSRWSIALARRRPGQHGDGDDGVGRLPRRPPDVAEIETAYHTLAPLLGIGAAGMFLVSLIASGISSSVVGTMAGQMIMQGFVGFRIPIWLRRLVTMVPAFVVVGLGVNATKALVVSQVVLSIALPVPMIALLMFTGRADIMGAFVNGR